MAIFSSGQSTHLFEVLVYAGADLTIFQDISGVCLILCLQSHTYFESAVLCAYFFVAERKFVSVISLFPWSFLSFLYGR